MLIVIILNFAASCQAASTDGLSFGGVSRIIEPIWCKTANSTNGMTVHKILNRARSRRHYAVALLALVLSFGFGGTAAATTSTSPHYMVTESQFGVGSSLHDCSASYCAKSSVGDTTVGSAHSDSYSAQFGFNTSDVPLLEVITNPVNENMGLLDSDKTGTAVQTIKIRDYLSKGYVLQITGLPPSQGEHRITRLTTPTASQQGNEQFGINLTANTAPTIGTSPVQVPTASYSFGTVADGYRQTNLFMYDDGDIVAQSLSSTGETDYTLSLIINVSSVTPGGRYDGNFSAVAVPMY